MSEMCLGAIPARDPIQPLVAAILLECSNGNFPEAELAALTLLKANLDSQELTVEGFIGLIQALFVIQRLDLVSAMLCDKHGFSGPVEIGVEAAGRNPACLRWEVQESGEQRFMFDESIFCDDNTTHKILHLHWIFPLFANYANSSGRESGSVIINQFDLGVSPGFAFCDNRPDYFLLPDQIFVPTGGYAYARKIFKENEVSWGARKPVAFWRGSTTGGPKAGPDDWRSLDRVKLCELAVRSATSNIFDVGLTQVVQFKDEMVKQDIEKAGLLRSFVPWQDWGEYKFLIEIDGNSAPFSNLFQRLLSGSPVLKVESRRGLRQWYYWQLVPWKNYIPIAPDMSDLADKVGWLLRNDDFARKVGQAGRALAERMTYERELKRSLSIISEGLRYFRDGGSHGTEPFGGRFMEEE